VGDDGRVESCIAMGSTERYNALQPRYREVSSADQQLNALIRLINLHHRCYDQEGYIAASVISDTSH
jgi:hypothetical protein